MHKKSHERITKAMKNAVLLKKLKSKNVNMRWLEELNSQEFRFFLKIGF